MKSTYLHVRLFALLLPCVLLDLGFADAETQDEETAIGHEELELLACEDDELVLPHIPDMPLLSDDDKNLIVEALRWGQIQVYPICAFSLRTHRDGEPVLVERFTPSEGYEGTWSVVSVGDEAPTVEFIEKYEHQGEQIYPPLPYDRYVNVTTLQRVSQTGTETTFTSTATDQMARGESRMAGMVEFIDVTLIVDELTRSLVSVEFLLRKPYKPNVFFKMNTFQQLHGLVRDDIVGDQVVKNFKMSMEGRILGVRRIKLDLDVELFDFRCLVKSNPKRSSANTRGWSPRSFRRLRISSRHRVKSRIQYPQRSRTPPRLRYSATTRSCSD